MSSWRELAAQVIGNPPVCESLSLSPPALCSVPSPATPQWLADEVGRLRGARPPRLRDPAVWRAVLDDAETLLRDGWAARALALGWHPLELYGADATGGDQYNGLAVWLDRRRIVVLDETHAVIRDGDWRRFLNRQRHFLDGGDGRGLAVFLWQFGRR
jgi:hypothetical protein